MDSSKARTPKYHDIYFTKLIYENVYPWATDKLLWCQMVTDFLISNVTHTNIND